MAVRVGPWKVHYQTQDAYGPGSRQAVNHNPPLVYHLEHDPSEKFNVAKTHPEVIAQAAEVVAKHRAELKPALSQLENENFLNQ